MHDGSLRVGKGKEAETKLLRKFSIFLYLAKAKTNQRMLVFAESYPFSFSKQ